MRPDFSHERGLGAQCGGPVAGVDEVGRGPWAGPVMACAVILNSQNFPSDLAARLDDSKKLSTAARLSLMPLIRSHAHIGLGAASVSEIDRINILKATLLAMRRAVRSLPVAPAAALVDGNRDPGLPCVTKMLVKGDGRSLSIAAASIIAKVVRDHLMVRLAVRYPEYGWHSNAGYGVRTHREALSHFGPTPHHRRSFAPVRRVLEERNNGVSYRKLSF